MLRSVVIEVRQHLRCINVFLKFFQSIKDADSLKINVGERTIRVEDATGDVVSELNVGKYFRISTKTVCNLVVEGENITFRVGVRDIQDLEQYDAKRTEAPVFCLEENKEASLRCSQCESTLCGPRMYEKIREYPSGAIDVSEFFCHQGPNMCDVLLPRPKDLLFGFQFVVLNRDNIEQSIKEKEGHVYCKRCKKYLGETMLNGRAVKLWNESVTVKYTGTGSVPFDLFQIDRNCMPEVLILKIINETTLPSPEPLLRNMHFTKVLLECYLPNRNRRYLLIHVMEKYLPVLRNTEQQAEGFNVDQYKRVEELEMRFAFKILYRLIDYKRNDDDDDMYSEPPIVKHWQRENVDLLKMNISPSLFKQLHDDLERNSLMLPEMYRSNKGQLTLSYIFQKNFS